MSFTPQFLDELRGRLSLAGIIGRRVRLTRRGHEWVGLCPFHNEKTPSFTVNEDKGFFHCFGCGAHGDVVGFLMRSEGLSFPEAVEKLAAEAGLPLPVSSPEERGRAQRAKTLLSATEAAAAWFQEQLQAPGGRAALAYLRERGVREETVARFRLGWAPDSRAALKAALTKAGFGEELLVEAGLLIRPDAADSAFAGATYDRFRGRVIFPISDRSGRAIAFGGRILRDGEPKYLNSPETPLFSKGRVLYGLAQATPAAREKNEIVAVEGYMDVIALAEAGFAQTVAPLGTALTEEQIALLWRFAPEPVLCFDGDAAGERAAARAAERALPLLKPGLSLRFALLPAGEDPDSLVRGQGPVALRALLDQAIPLSAMLWRLETAGQSLDTPERRAGLRHRLRERIARIADRTVQEAYRAELEQRFEALFGVQRGGRTGGRRPQRDVRSSLGGEAARRGVSGLQRRQELALAVFINHPELLHHHTEELAQIALSSAKLNELRRAMISLAAQDQSLDAAILKRHLTALGYGPALEEVLSRTKTIAFSLPEASLEQAGAGLAHLLGVMREAEARRDQDLAAQALAEDMSSESLDRFEAARRHALEGESQRRDLDMPMQPAALDEPL